MTREGMPAFVSLLRKILTLVHDASIWMVAGHRCDA